MLKHIDEHILNKPIPDFEKLRTKRLAVLKKVDGYQGVAFDSSHPLHDDPIVPLEAYGVRGMSYYANMSWVGEAGGFELAMKKAYVRQDIAQRLARVNEFLGSSQADFIHDSLGGRVDLFVTDGLRPKELVKELYDNIVPEAIRRDHPNMPESEVLRWRDHRIAKPTKYAPHATGGAIDVVLSFKELNQKVPTGFSRDNMESMYPEFMEKLAGSRQLLDDEHKALLCRRILYHLLEAAESQRGGMPFVNNGLELWHFSAGDYYAGFVSGLPAYYAQIEQLPKEV